MSASMTLGLSGRGFTDECRNEGTTPPHPSFRTPRLAGAGPQDGHPVGRRRGDRSGCDYTCQKRLDVEC